MMTTWVATLVLAALLQDKPAPKEDHEDLTPEKAVQMLKDIQGLMTKSEGSQKDAVEKMAEIIRKAKS
jgi:hypothetical protein